MSDESFISIGQGRLSGRVVENIFFRDTRDQLQGFWGVENLRELSIVDSLRLPLVAYEYINQKTADTQQDGRERAASLGFNHGAVVIRDEYQGEQSINQIMNSGFFSDFELAVGSDGVVSDSLKRLFGRPHPIFFHTHPHIYGETVTKSNIRFPNGKILPVEPQKFTEVLNFQMDSFSTPDLATFFQSNRHLNSMLLSTHKRLLYIAPSELFLQAGLAALDRSHIPYDNRMTTINHAVAVRMLNIDLDELLSAQPQQKKEQSIATMKATQQILNQNPSLDDLKRQRDQVLVDVCKKAGYEVFASEAHDKDQLKRLN